MFVSVWCRTEDEIQGKQEVPLRSCEAPGICGLLGEDIRLLRCTCPVTLEKETCTGLGDMSLWLWSAVFRVSSISLGLILRDSQAHGELILSGGLGSLQPSAAHKRFQGWLQLEDWRQKKYPSPIVATV
jgi:hypothetical protein